MLKKHPRYERDRAPAIIRRFCPHYHVKTLSEIDASDLVSAGLRGILIDLDNTLLPWKGSDVPQDTVDWVADCQNRGLKLCLVSNTRNYERLQKISEQLKIPTVRAGKMKPSREGFRLALKVLDMSPEEVVMVGDQMFTDVWGGNRMGMCTIYVERMHHKEFFFTRFSRFFERIIMRLLAKFRGTLQQ